MGTTSERGAGFPLTDHAPPRTRLEADRALIHLWAKGPHLLSPLRPVASRLEEDRASIHRWAKGPHLISNLQNLLIMIDAGHVELRLQGPVGIPHKQLKQKDIFSCKFNRKMKQTFFISFMPSLQ